MKYQFQIYVRWFLLVVLGLGGIAPLRASALPLDSCEVYLHVESQMKCGPLGYVQTFAYPYCEAYLEKKRSFSRAGQKILQNIRLCLQEVLLEYGTKMTCDDLPEYGFASHEYCYLASGFCHLSPHDKLKVFWMARSEVLNPAILKTALKVEKACLHQ